MILKQVPEKKGEMKMAAENKKIPYKIYLEETDPGCFRNLPQDFPGSPVVGSPRFHCRGHASDPWLGKLRSRMLRGTAKKEREREKKTRNLPQIKQVGRYKFELRSLSVLRA